MTDNLIFSVNMDVLLRAGISVNQYFMLQLIKNKQAELFMEYRTQFANPVSKEDLQLLIKNGFLGMRDSSKKFTFENLYVTDDFLNLSEIKVDDALAELREVYPKFTPEKKRRLQADSHKWGPKYLSIIKRDRSLHDKIIKCIKAELKHRKSTNSEEFWALLTTYVNNKRWEVYMDGLDELSLEEVTNNYDI